MTTEPVPTDTALTAAPVGVSRRGLIAGGAVAAGAIALPSAHTSATAAGGAPSRATSPRSTTSPVGEVPDPIGLIGPVGPVGRDNVTIPVPAAGMLPRRLRLTPFDFRCTESLADVTYGAFGPVQPPINVGQPTLFAVARFPQGARITGATIYAHVDDSVGGLEVVVEEFGESNPLGNSPAPIRVTESDTVVTQTSAPTTLHQKQITLNITNDFDRTLVVRVFNNRGTDNNIQAIDFEFLPPPTFVPISPSRVLDTRNAGTPGAGILAANDDRTIFVGDSRDLTGAVDVMDVLPTLAVAASINVTVAGTSGRGFLSVAPSSTSSSSSSTINWTGPNQAIANGSVGRSTGISASGSSTARARVTSSWT